MGHCNLNMCPKFEQCHGVMMYKKSWMNGKEGRKSWLYMYYSFFFFTWVCLELYGQVCGFLFFFFSSWHHYESKKNKWYKNAKKKGHFVICKHFWRPDPTSSMGYSFLRWAATLENLSFDICAPCGLRSVFASDILIRVFIVCMRKLCILDYPKCTQWYLPFAPNSFLLE